MSLVVEDALLVRELVRTLAERARPGNADLARRAVDRAMDAHLAGASIAEAYQVGKEVVAASSRPPKASQRAAAH